MVVGISIFVRSCCFFYMTTEECDGKYIKSDQLLNSTLDFVVNKVVLSIFKPLHYLLVTFTG